MELSRLNNQNLRDFFVNYICHSSVSARAHCFKPVSDNTVGGAVGKIRVLQHGDIVFGITDADQPLSAQLLLQKPGGFGFGNTFCVDIDDSSAGSENIRSRAGC